MKFQSETVPKSINSIKSLVPNFGSDKAKNDKFCKKIVIELIELMFTGDLQLVALGATSTP